MSPQPKKRRRPFLERQAKRQHLQPPPPPTLLTLPDDVFLRIISYLQNGTHHRASVFQTAKHAFNIARVSNLALSRFRASLHTIDVLHSTKRDCGSPPLLKEQQPPHISNLISLARHHLRVLSLPRYEACQIGAEAILPMIRHCTNLQSLSFVDGGRIDKALTKTIFLESLKVVNIEKPSNQMILSLANSSALLNSLTLSYIPFSAIPHLVQLLKFRAPVMENLSLGFDIRSVQVVEDSLMKAGRYCTTMIELRNLLSEVYEHFNEWLPSVENVEVSCCDLHCLEHLWVSSGEIVTRGLQEITGLVNERRLKPGSIPGTLGRITLCERSLKAIPGLPTRGEVRVRLPGYEFCYRVRGDEVAQPFLLRCQLNEALCGLDNFWSLTGAIDTLNIGDERMVRRFEHVRNDVCNMISNARSLRCVVVRVSLSSFDFAVRVMKYLTCILQRAPWVEQVEVSHQLTGYHARPEFTALLRAMGRVRVVHLSAPMGRHYGKGRMIAFVKALPRVLRSVAEWCEGLRVLYCERVGEMRGGLARHTTIDLIRKLGEIDVVLDGRLGNVDCSSLKALVVMWIEQIECE